MILLIIAVLLLVVVLAGTRGRSVDSAARRRAFTVLAAVVGVGVVVWVVVIAVQAGSA
ncbi:hypothetical protein [Phycicoccus sonneratiae]|uniref:Uncharacterized protein n=1 Tax=Phycicoccus sonneratiae TaxID=2807628 RepID=A0ABS2CG48_9MICO|nr:hypothetical protein [Phycicoccus sonneraticus]MBM6398843.1 hypothetical protein [Phycicoccus sonneraticus]